MTEKAKTLRNIALVGHGGSGKTSLAEAMLFKAGVTTRKGRVEDGNTVMDFDPDEHQRQTSISTAFHQFNYKNHTINIIDTPGDQNFFSDTKSCMRVAEGAVVVVDAVDGFAVRTEQALEFAEQFNLPVAAFINKLDRERADFDTAVQSAADLIEIKPVVVQLPIGKEAGFKGVVDLITRKAYIYDENGKASVEDIPSDMADDAATLREEMIENIAEADDELLEKYLEGETLTDEELVAGLKSAVRARSFMPVLCGSGVKEIGLDLLEDFIIESMPSPVDLGPVKGKDESGDNEIERIPDADAPFSAFVFKTVVDPYAGLLSIFKIVSGKLGKDGNFYNATKQAKERFTQLLRIEGKNQKQITGAGPGEIVAVAKLKDTKTGDTLCDESDIILFEPTEPIPSIISYAIQAASKGDEDKLFSSLTRLLEEDNSLQLTRNQETREIILSGVGQIHIESTVQKLKRKFNVDVNLKLPKVPYRETIKKQVRVQGKHKKQSGGHGQYGDCWISIEPMPRGEGFEFVDKIVGGSIPKQYIPAVEKGIQEAAEKGILAGFPCVDFKVVLDDGSYHSVDSSEMAFKMAGSLAFKKAVQDASPVLLEPIMNVTVTAPDSFMGDIMGDMNSRRGRVLGMDGEGKKQNIKAHVPMAEILQYAPELRSMTGGRGIFTTDFSHYDEVPFELAEKVIEKVKSDENEK